MEHYRRPVPTTNPGIEVVDTARAHDLQQSGKVVLLYFTRNLEALSNNDKTTPLMFFCTSDCWQSWNAARRARLWGYEHIFWYPSGTDGWFEEGHTLTPVEPVNFLGEEEQD